MKNEVYSIDDFLKTNGYATSPLDNLGSPSEGHRSRNGVQKFRKPVSDSRGWIAYPRRALSGELEPFTPASAIFIYCPAWRFLVREVMV